MMGQRGGGQDRLFYSFNLDDHVPRNHLLRGIDLFKPPGMAETLDWSRALLALGTVDLNEQAVDDSLGVILKYQEDVDSVRGDVAANLVGRALQRT